MMQEPQFIILYVKDPLQSGKFYETLLNKKPSDASPSFVKFTLNSGVMLGLWAKDGVTPELDSEGHGCELDFIVRTPEDLKSMFQEWKLKGINIIQDISDLHFGHTFTGVDPDGHRLRVLLPKG